MPVNPYTKGGSDVPVVDGGTGASDAASGLSNLGGLDTAGHAATNHSGIPGVGDLTVAAHATTDHSGITNVNRSFSWITGGNASPADTTQFFGGISSGSPVPITCRVTSVALSVSGGTSWTVDVRVNGSSVGNSSSHGTGGVQAVNYALTAGDDIEIAVNSTGGGNYAVSLFFEP